MNSFKAIAILAAVAQARVLGRSGTAGTTTRYWDCCKASCSWNNGFALSAPVTTCDIHDQPLAGGDSATNGCPELGDGTAFMCSTQQPWAVNDTVAYGFAAVTSSNQADTCCACYKLTFTDSIVGKSMVVQATNIGGDVSETQFDLAMPGGGVGAFPKGCTKEWNAPTNGWGGQAYGGISSRSECASLPAQLQTGCYFRFDWFQGANNPGVQYERVSCPAELVAKSNCRRNDDGATSPATPDPTPSSVQPAGPSATQYGQCGGSGYNGPTQCPAGTTCQKQSDYYSQCL